MHNWKEYKLNDLAVVQLSNVDKKTKANEKTVRLCNYTDVYKNAFINNEKAQNFMVATCNDNEFKKFLLKEGQVAITKDSETTDDIGVPTYIATSFNDVLLGYHLSLITPNKNKLDGKFLYYYLNTKQSKLYFTNNAGGSGQRCSLSLVCIKSTPVNIPDLDTQKTISKILFDLDAKIELNNRINAELEAMAKTIYDYWFVQFDFPNENGKPYKSSGGKMVYNKQLKREIPSNWVVEKIGNILNTSLGGTPSTKEKHFWENGVYNWLNSGEIANFPIVSSELKITQEAIKDSATELLSKGTVLLSITRHLRPTVLAIDACANQSVVGIKEKGELKYYFLYPYLKNEIPRLMSLRIGAQQPHINKEIVDDSVIVLPDSCSNLLELYNSKVAKPYEMIMNNAFENQQLTQLRDWLLPMLMNGQVKVK